MRIGESLTQAGLISVEELNLALAEQERTHDRLGDILLRMGYISPEKMAPFLAGYFKIPFVNLKEIYKDIKPDVIDVIPVELARRFNAIPIDCKDKALTVAVADPLDLLAIDTMRVRTGLKIQCVVASDSDILEAIEYCYQHLPRLLKHVENFILTESPTENQATMGPPEKLLEANDRPVVQYVKDLIVQAVNNSASDIHIKPKESRVELRFRIDGVLHHMEPPPQTMLSAITTRLKIMAGLDISERRLPQDGRFKVTIGKNEVDVRISCFPTIYGESLVMRLLDTSHPLLGLETLGFCPTDLPKFMELVNSAYGLILVTGPTGSGKTTTLYTTLNAIKSDKKNIITIEDPVEYRLPFIQQSQVNAQIGFDFARGLRSILRQDPDVIMVGEIRDRETAEIAIHAALTGHLVFSTLHTNDAATAAVRLVNMGVEPYLISSALLGIVAQRLIRTVCSECRQAYEPPAEILKKLSIHSKSRNFVTGHGCSKCLKSGYKGRKGIYELLVIDDVIRQMILERRSNEEIVTRAKSKGMKTLRETGIEKLHEGITTAEELMRVTQQTTEF